MAATLTLTAATPHMLKYQWNYDGTGGAGSSSAVRTQAQMVADLLAAGIGPSPLKDLLANATTDAAWNALQQGAKLSVYTTVKTLTAGTGLQTRLETFVGPGHALQISGVDGNAGQADIEVKFHHTIDR